MHFGEWYVVPNLRPVLWGSRQAGLSGWIFFPLLGAAVQANLWGEDARFMLEARWLCLCWLCSVRL